MLPGTDIFMLTKEEIEALFPGLAERFTITSDSDDSYNCIAWTLNDTRRSWWPWPKRFVYWPLGAPREETVTAFPTMYRILLFEPCDNADREDGFDKIALYAIDDVPTHAARLWKEDASWSSKLGDENDIGHQTLESIEGIEYGNVVQVMKRRRGSPR
jgi:hypothetical protein